tara:strand:- start:290 stop:1207 length:918 start_codon:yes stop_codon:yes gene_type:complete
MSNILKYPSDLDSNNLYKHRIQFKNKVHQNQSNQSRYGEKSVHLYMPADALKTSYSQTFADTDLGAFGNLARNFSQDKIDQVATAATSGNVDRMMSTLANIGLDKSNQRAVTQALVKGAVKQVIGGETGAGTVAALTGKVGAIINPFKAVMYTGPGGFRTFSFTFIMQPENKNEADTIKEIVRFFKYNMHPGLSNLEWDAVKASHHRDAKDARSETGKITTSAYLTYPDTFEIKLQPQGKEQTTNSTKNSLFKIKPCFLESFNVDYSTSGGPAFFDNDGSPATTTIAMQFKETELMTRQSIDQGY